MAREILFRGIDNDTGEWVYGSFCMDALEQMHGPFGAPGYIRFLDKATALMLTVGVDRGTVGQYTGCLDRNGRRIFEGDYLCASDDEDSNPIPVKFAQGSFCVKIDDEYWPLSIYMYEGKCILGICGNIHDGPTCKDK